MTTHAEPGDPGTKYYTVDEANKTLPLLRVILRDITVLAQEMRDRHERLSQMRDVKAVGGAHAEELKGIAAEFDRNQDQMKALEDELRKLHVELKDYFTGLIDFRHRHEDRDVYLCWRLGEPTVAHWHELETGFAGRQKLTQDFITAGASGRRDLRS